MEEKLEEINKKINEIVYNCLNQFSDRDEKEQVMIVMSQINECFINRDTLYMSDDKIKELLSNYRLNSQYSKEFSKINNHGYLEDHEENKKHYKDIESILKSIDNEQEYLINILAMETYIQTIDPQDLTLELIDLLKYKQPKKLSENDLGLNEYLLKMSDYELTDDQKAKRDTMFFEIVRSDAYYGMIEQYLENIVPEKIDESLLEYLYENDYKGAISNPLIEFAYKAYCEGKENDKNNEVLEQRVSMQDEVISKYEEHNSTYSKDLRRKNDIVKGMKSKVFEVFKTCQDLISSTNTIISEMKKSNENSFFSKVMQGAKNSFSKLFKRNLLPSPIDIKTSNIIDLLESTKKSIEDFNKFSNIDTTYDHSSLVETINKYNEKSGKALDKSKFIGSSAPVLTEEQISSLGNGDMQNITPEAFTESVMKYLYDSKYSGDFTDSSVRLAYKMFCYRQDSYKKSQQNGTEYLNKDALIRKNNECAAEMFDLNTSAESVINMGHMKLEDIAVQLNNLYLGIKVMQESYRKEQSKGFFSRLFKRNDSQTINYAVVEANTEEIQKITNPVILKNYDVYDSNETQRTIDALFRDIQECKEIIYPELANEHSAEQQHNQEEIVRG